MKRSNAVEIDGLGVFGRDLGPETSPLTTQNPRISIAYAMADAVAAEQLFRATFRSGIRRVARPAQTASRAKLAPQHRRRNSSSDFFVACFSRQSVRKRGGFQAEVRYALDCAKRVPLDDVFIIPVRLDDCRVPARIQKETQYVDLFPDWDAGLHRVFRIIE